MQAITASDFTASWNAVEQEIKKADILQRRKTLKEKADHLRDPGADLKPEDFKAYELALQAVNDAWVELEVGAVKLFNDFSTQLALPAKSLPNVVEVSLLRSATGPQALLFESPEPLDWRRLKLKLGYSPHTPVAASLLTAPLGASIKISGASLPALPARTDYWVSLFARQQTDLSAYQLEVATDVSEPIFQPYFSFPPGISLVESQQLAVYSTAPASPPDGNLDILIQDPTLLQSGKLHGLPEKIAWIRLLNDRGQVMDQRAIQTDEYYQTSVGGEITFDLAMAGANGARQILVIPNGDGTQALLLQKEDENVAIAAGSYLLTLEFQRDIGPEAPLLRAAGRTAPETVRLEISIPS